MTKMKWIEPKHSRKRIRRAGTVLCGLDEASEKDAREAFVALMNWRATHAYPMHCLLMLLRLKAAQADKAALVVQRLKRLRSVVLKLQRFEQMSLNRMQDIGGCRAVVRNLRRVQQLRGAMKSSRTRHKLQREYDYISQPKDSGYRAVHMVYRYGGRKHAFNGLSVEVQLRSRNELPCGKPRGIRTQRSDTFRKAGAVAYGAWCTPSADPVGRYSVESPLRSRGGRPC